MFALLCIVMVLTDWKLLLFFDYSVWDSFFCHFKSIKSRYCQGWVKKISRFSHGLQNGGFRRSMASRM